MDAIRCAIWFEILFDVPQIVQDTNGATWLGRYTQPYCFVQMRTIFIKNFIGWTASSTCSYLFENLLKPPWFLRLQVNCGIAKTCRCGLNLYPQCARFQFTVYHHGKPVHVKPTSHGLRMDCNIAVLHQSLHLLLTGSSAHRVRWSMHVRICLKLSQHCCAQIFIFQLHKCSFLIVEL